MKKQSCFIPWEQIETSLKAQASPDGLPDEIILVSHDGKPPITYVRTQNPLSIKEDRFVPATRRDMVRFAAALIAGMAGITVLQALLAALVK